MGSAGLSARSARDLLIAGLCWLAALEFFVGPVLAQLAWTGFRTASATTPSAISAPPSARPSSAPPILRPTPARHGQP